MFFFLKLVSNILYCHVINIEILTAVANTYNFQSIFLIN